MNNYISVLNGHLEYINERLVLLTIDTGHLVLALQADWAISKGLINAVIMAISDNATINEDLSNQIYGILSVPQGLSSHEQPQHRAHSRNQAGKPSLWLCFVITMLWVGIISLFIILILSLMPYQPVNAKPIVTDSDNSKVREG